MKIKILSILVVFVIAAILPVACNADKGQSGDKKSGEIVNSENPGEEMEISKYLVEGKTNIVDFYSEYCSPCRRSRLSVPLLFGSVKVVLPCGDLG